VECGIAAIAWAGEGLAVMSHDDRLTICDAASGAVTREIPITIPGRVTAFAVHVRSMTAVWATEIASWRFFFGRGELYVASIAGDAAKPVRCGTHDIRVEAMAVQDDPPRLISGSLDGTVRSWDLQRAMHKGEQGRHWDRVTALLRLDADQQ